MAHDAIASRLLVAKILDGVPLGPSEFEFYRQVTGREAPPTKATSEAYLIKPRRAAHED